jgi:hypothetical protein
LLRMARILIALALCASLSPLVAGAAGTAGNENHDHAGRSSAQSVNPVVQWNRNLLLIVRTPGVQPATVHPTRSFAIMHAAIYDAVNSIDRTHKPYLVRLSNAPRDASQEAAAAAAAHRVLVALYTTLKSTLDTELLESLAQIPDGERKTKGILVGENSKKESSNDNQSFR